MSVLKDLISGAGCAADGSAVARNPLGNVVNQLMESVPSVMGMGGGRGAGAQQPRRLAVIVSQWFIGAADCTVCCLNGWSRAERRDSYDWRARIP